MILVVSTLNAADKATDTGKGTVKSADKATDAGRLADKVDNIGDASKANKPYEMHHYATNKNKTYTPDMKKITDKYGLDLDDMWNKELLPHKGRHPNAYHDMVLEAMNNADSVAKGNQKLFLELFEKSVKQKVRENPEILYKEYWRNLGQ
ncbi:AHH domain-containing protein [Aerococcaceae bacterium NML201296]|nr:AHH domain-containing protein [Aerococcaceae bacterium NML201296]